MNIEVENTLHAARKAKQGESTSYFVILLAFVSYQLSPIKHRGEFSKDQDWSSNESKNSSPNVTRMRSVVTVM